MKLPDPIIKVHANYAELVADDELDAIYIASHQGDHFEHAMLAIEAGKSILVEKPITYLPEQAEQIFAAAARHKVLAMEAMWTRYLPQSTILRQLLASGELGTPELMTNRSLEQQNQSPQLVLLGQMAWTKKATRSSPMSPVRGHR